VSHTPDRGAPRRARHLIDFDNPRTQVRAGGGMTLTRVQMWVLSTFAVTTVLHFSGGLVAAAFYVPESRADARIGLLVLSGLVGVLSVVAGRAIHQKGLLSWWLVLGWAPGILGAYLLLVR
jgi:hypothetical protein